MAMRIAQSATENIGYKLDTVCASASASVSPHYLHFFH
jgi:hypothetical protein